MPVRKYIHSIKIQEEQRREYEGGRLCLEQIVSFGSPMLPLLASEVSVAVFVGNSQWWKTSNAKVQWKLGANGATTTPYSTFACSRSKRDTVKQGGNSLLDRSKYGTFHSSRQVRGTNQNSGLPLWPRRGPPVLLFKVFFF